MTQDNYWLRRLSNSRSTRRRFLGTAAATGTGAAALGLVGCGDDDDDGDATAAPTTASSPGSSPAASASPSAAPGVQRAKGGIVRFSSANNTWDTFDADRTRFGPMGTLLGLANMGVVGWSSFADVKIGGYFAGSYEQPDKTTYVFKVRDNLFWHNKAPVNGRAATADDIVKFINRNKEGKLKDGSLDPNFYRKADFEVVDKAEAVDAKTVRVTLTKQWPYFLNTLAGTWAKIQAPESVDKFETEYSKFNGDQIIGTGDYVLTSFKAEGELKFRRTEKPAFNAWIDGIDFVPLFVDEAGLQASFEQKQIDVWAPRQKATLDDVKKRYEGKIFDKTTFGTNPVTGTFYGGAAPWNNKDLIMAIFRTMDRRGLVQQFLQGRGVMAAYAPPGWDPFAIPEKELIQLPGYLEDRTKELAEAKKQWDAGGGPALGKITVDFPDIYEGGNPGVAAAMTGLWKQVLGNDFEAKLEPYSTITSKIVAQKYGSGNNNIWAGWGNPPSDLDPSLDFIKNFNSTKPNFKQWGVVMPSVDAATVKLESEFDTQKRVELCREIGKELIRNAGGGIMHQYLQITTTLFHNYYKPGEVNQFVNVQNISRDLSLDQKDPSWAGRPA